MNRIDMDSRKSRIQNHINGYINEMIELRRDLHRNPELGFEEQRTSAIVARQLKDWGYDVCSGLGKTGVVGTLKNGTSKRSVGIRADMDALPIQEKDHQRPYASQRDGIMHACGHDGHTATLLAAARYLAETKRFDGTVNLIFQPAEEGLAGAKAMIDDGLFERFPCDEVYGLHNWPNNEEGKIFFRSGVIMAASDRVQITITGTGGHGAYPHTTRDPIVAGAAIITALQTIVARRVAPLDCVVVTVGAFHAGTVCNIIPEKAEMLLTVRTHNADTRAALPGWISEVVTSTAAAHGCQVKIDYKYGYPTTVNSTEQTDHIARIATSVFGPERTGQCQPKMGGEDFSFMLEKVPGAYVLLGAGSGPELHNPEYDFNDALILTGATLWGALVEDRLQPIEDTVKKMQMETC